MPCLVCGEPKTIKAHVFPRALFHDIRDGMPFALMGTQDREGAKFSQSGMWDSEILCEAHERQLSDADDYAVEFCRTFDESAQKLEDAPGYIVGNPRPELLVRFVMSVVWRFAVSHHGKEQGVNLGPYENHLSSLIFDPYTTFVEPEIIVVRREYRLDGIEIKLGTNPHPWRFQGVRYWNFHLASFDFRMKLDSRNDEFGSKILANGNDPLIVFDHGIDDVRNARAIIYILKNISKSREWWFAPRIG